MCVRTDIVPAANSNQPVAVDLLLVGDKALLKKLAALSAADWFDQRAQFLRDYPDEKDLHVYQHEWVPGQSIPCMNVPGVAGSLPIVSKSKAVLVFANYFTKGDHRAQIKKAQSLVIHLMEDDFQILQIKDCDQTSCPLADH